MSKIVYIKNLGLIGSQWYQGHKPNPESAVFYIFKPYTKYYSPVNHHLVWLMISTQIWKYDNSKFCPLEGL